MNRINTSGRKMIRSAHDGRLYRHVWIVRSNGSALTVGYQPDRRNGTAMGTAWPPSGFGVPVKMTRAELAREIRRCRRRGYRFERCAA